jgi:hypothetical protein
MFLSGLWMNSLKGNVGDRGHFVELVRFPAGGHP